MHSVLSTLALLLTVVLTTLAEGNGCRFPPHLWCSSRETARLCEVEHQCDKNVWSVPRQDAPPVSFTLYLESLCPDCKNFISNQLWPTFIKLAPIMNLTLVPYGNAMEKQVGDHWEFTCQHGPDECVGNIIETCAIHLNPRQESFMPFIACIEMSDDLPWMVAPQCALKHKLQYSDIDKCANGTLGNQLEHAMAEKTGRLDPPHTSVPWVTLNGVHNDSIQQAAEENLAKLICDTYQGFPHKVCNETRLG